MNKFNFLVFILLTVVAINGCFRKNIAENNNNVNIAYYPITEPFCAEVSLNGSKKAFFVLDSGSPSGHIMLDSVYFYENIDCDELEMQNLDYNMIYWQKFYMGNLNIEVAGTKFEKTFTKIDVNTKFQEINKHREQKLFGLIGVDVFSDKIMIINFKDNLFAISDTLIVDFNLNDFTVIDLERAREIKKGNEDWRYLTIDGFVTKDNNIKTGLFLLDTGNWYKELVMKSSFGKNIKYEKKETHKGGFFTSEDWIWKSDTLILGNKYKINNVEIAINKLPPSEDWMEMLTGGDGLVGLPFLKRFDIVILDYKNDKLYLKKP